MSSDRYFRLYGEARVRLTPCNLFISIYDVIQHLYPSGDPKVTWDGIEPNLQHVIASERQHINSKPCVYFDFYQFSDGIESPTTSAYGLIQLVTFLPGPRVRRFVLYHLVDVIGILSSDVGIVNDVKAIQQTIFCMY
jgi:hypothetical protein